MSVLLTTFLAAFAGSYLLVWKMRALGALDEPNARSLHTTPTPRGGGLAIVAAVLAAWAFALLRGGAAWTAWLLPALALFIAVLGWLDDKHSLSVRVRLGGQTAAAAAVVWAYGHPQALPFPGIGTLELGPLGAVVAVLWIVGLTNAYNFMDGIDGLAGAQAAAAGLGWAAFGWWSGREDVTVLGAAVTAAGLGFLLHNWPPADIFMGDVGSAFLGFIFAGLALRGGTPASGGGTPASGGGTPSGETLLYAVLLVWPIVSDSVFTFLCRLRRGENVFEAHRSHVYQRLVLSGLSHGTVSSLYAVLALLGAAAAASSLEPRAARFLPTACAALAACGVGVWLWTLARERTARGNKL